MLGERSDQMGLWEADQLYLDLVGGDTFYPPMADWRRCEVSCSVMPTSPSSIAWITAGPACRLLLRRTGHGVVVAGPRQGERRRGQGPSRLRHPVEGALGVEIEDRPFAKSTFQVFRAQLILHDKVREVFEQSLRLAREKGYLKRGRGMRVALDTTYILGQGAVKDTHNLLADGIIKLMRALAAVEDVPVRRWAETHGYNLDFAQKLDKL